MLPEQKAAAEKRQMELSKSDEDTQWTLISALNRVLLLARESGLEDTLWEECKNPLAFLREQLHLTNIQLVVIALLAEEGEPMTFFSLSKALDCPRLSLMVYKDEIDELVQKRWTMPVCSFRIGRSDRGLALEKGVIKAFCQNRPFEPEKIDDLSQDEFITKLVRRLAKHVQSQNVLFADDERWMDQLLKANPSLPISREVLQYEDIHTRSLLMMIVFCYLNSDGIEADDGLHSNALDELFPDEYDCKYIRRQLQDGSHELMNDGLVEQMCEDGIVNPLKYQLTREGRERLIPGYVAGGDSTHSRPGNRSMLCHKDIKEKALFFNPGEQEQIDRMAHLLDRSNLADIQRRLTEQGMRKGVACLFYGAPGTGKTETVLQLARQTGRDIMQVDISKMRDKYVGESEKNIKAIFNNYRNLCKRSEVMPILLFNEADAIISKRFENMRNSVEQMDNAMQNIILQEMENLKGILIATTNLTSNLDSAFERRFLFKVEFHKPEAEVKAKIWQSMIQDLSPEDARLLASKYDFSGGQIENIARKRSIDYVLTGKAPTLEQVSSYCDHEVMYTQNRRKPVTGFTI
jgi:hypothetical protein